MSSISKFIPSFHYMPSDKKMTAEWFDIANRWCWYNSNNRSLLEGKNIFEIQGYATGNYPMTPYRRMFKSENKKLAQERLNNPNNLFTVQEYPIDGFVQTPLINVKLNSAIAIVEKVPMDVSAKAIDALATKKKQEDIAFLKNKPKLEGELQELADQMQIGKVDLGTTKHSAVPFSDSPYGLDLNEPDELQVFVDLLYNLAVEAAFETANMGFYDIKNAAQVRHLEIKDQFWYGVSAHYGFKSAMTLLPDLEYVFPGDVRTPFSNLPDKNDNPYRFLEKRVTGLELLNFFKDDICDEAALDFMLNAPVTGYCACNSISDTYHQNDFGSCKIDLILCMIKSVDFVGIAPLNKKSRFTYVVTDPEEAEKCTTKIYGQNTYCAWWLKNTKYYFGIEKLDFSHRTEGQESYQNFPVNLYVSQEKSAVELSIGENKKAQVADIKMQHAILKSLPAGKYIDLKYLRGALGGLKEGKEEYTIDRLVNLATEENIMIGDTSEFEDTKNGGQFKPFQELPGGVKSEVIGYLQVIADANMKISQYTGINENLIGQKAEELVRNNNALINAGINALQYVTSAIEQQYQKLFTNWSSIIKRAVEAGGKSKEAIVNLIGSKKVSLIEALDDLPLHNIGIMLKMNQNERVKQDFEMELNRLKINNVINTVDIYMLEAITNPKDKMALLAVMYKKWEKRENKKRQEDFANQQAMVQAQGQNQQNAVREKMSGEIQKIYAQGDTSAKILQLAAQLGIQDKQMDFLGKKSLQQDRGKDQTDKAISTLQTKAELENQKPFGT